jgi:putative redox protein
LGELSISVAGTRADAVPAVFTSIELRFEAKGVDEDRLRRAVDLSMEKYCSVKKMLETTARITTTVTVNGS